jgi:hypothetical protein
MLISSVVDPFRITVAFSRDPVVVSADWKPPASASVKMKTQATSPMPSAVRIVLTRRTAKFRTL